MNQYQFDPVRMGIIREIEKATARAKWSMTPVEIRDTWDELSESEAFEAFECAGLDYDQVEAILGAEVASDYATWSYFNVK